MAGMSLPLVRHRSYEEAATLRLTLDGHIKYLTRAFVCWLGNAACTFPNTNL
jgi:hypothetical protein